jgi:hypothetical protein
MTSTCDWLALSPHPTARSSVVSAVEAATSWTAGGNLTLGYRLHGEIARLRLPTSKGGQRLDGLWQHTCCEAFIARHGETGYREFNFSPSGDWAAYAFSGTRQRDGAADPGSDARPEISVRHVADCLELAATLPAAALPDGGRWQIGLSVVVEDDAGALSYWALRHPSPHPDFHHRDAFAFNLDPGPHE